MFLKHTANNAIKTMLMDFFIHMLLIHNKKVKVLKLCPDLHIPCSAQMGHHRNFEAH